MVYGVIYRYVITGLVCLWLLDGHFCGAVSVNFFTSTAFQGWVLYQ